MDHSELDGDCSASEHERSPHEAVFFVLAYLPVYEILAMAQVCKSLRDAVRNDILPWLKLVFDRPLSYRLTDAILMELASRGKGRIQVLALINCSKITDDGLLRVVASNPNITEMYLPGCTSLTPEAIIEAAKHVRLNRISIHSICFTQRQLKTLQQLVNKGKQVRESKVLYHEYMKLSPLQRMKAGPDIDVDICPKCNEAGLVFDCPKASCGVVICRGCTLCVGRCIECGACLRKDDEIEETCCEDAMCSECWIIQQPKCSLCNKPCCSRHADQQIPRDLGSSGFVCDSCHFNFV